MKVLSDQKKKRMKVLDLKISLPSRPKKKKISLPCKEYVLCFQSTKIKCYSPFRAHPIGESQLTTTTLKATRKSHTSPIPNSYKQVM